MFAPVAYEALAPTIYDRCEYAWLGSARLGSARLGSARLGSARLGSARLGSARLGSDDSRGSALTRCSANRPCESVAAPALARTGTARRAPTVSRSTRPPGPPGPQAALRRSAFGDDGLFHCPSGLSERSPVLQDVVAVLQRGRRPSGTGLLLDSHACVPTRVHACVCVHRRRHTHSHSHAVRSALRRLQHFHSAVARPTKFECCNTVHRDATWHTTLQRAYSCRARPISDAKVVLPQLRLLRQVGAEPTEKPDRPPARVRVRVRKRARVCSCW
jgi:hypothetical protein